MQLFSLLFVCSLILKEKGTQNAVVQTLDRAIQWINFKQTICVIRWKVIYPGYGAIHLNNNWGLVIGSADQIFITTNTFYCMSESSHALNNNNSLYYTHLEITGDPCNLIGSQLCDLFTKYIYFLLLITSVLKLHHLLGSKSHHSCFKSHHFFSTSFHFWVVKALFNKLAPWSMNGTDWILWCQTGCNKVVTELCVV